MSPERLISHVVLATEVDRSRQGWEVRGHSEDVAPAEAATALSTAPHPFFLERVDSPPWIGGVSADAFATPGNIEKLHVSVVPSRAGVDVAFSGAIADPLRATRPWRVMTRAFHVPDDAWPQLGGDPESLLYGFAESQLRPAPWYALAVGERFQSETPILVPNPSLTRSDSPATQRQQRIRWFLSRLHDSRDRSVRLTAVLLEALAEIWQDGGGLLIEEEGASSERGLLARVAWLCLPEVDRRRVSLATGMQKPQEQFLHICVVFDTGTGRLPNGMRIVRLDERPEPHPLWIDFVREQAGLSTSELLLTRQLSILDGEFGHWTDVILAAAAYRQNPSLTTLADRIGSRFSFPDPLSESEIEGLVDDFLSLLDPASDPDRVQHALDVTLSRSSFGRSDSIRLLRQIVTQLTKAPLPDWSAAGAAAVLQYLADDPGILDEEDGVDVLRREAEKRDKGEVGPIGALENWTQSVTPLMEYLRSCRAYLIESNGARDWGRRLARDPLNRYASELSELPDPFLAPEGFWGLSLLEGYLRKRPRSDPRMPLPGWLLSPQIHSVEGLSLSHFPNLTALRLEHLPEPMLMQEFSTYGVATETLARLLQTFGESFDPSDGDRTVWHVWGPRLHAAGTDLRALEAAVISDAHPEDHGRPPVWWAYLVCYLSTVPELSDKALTRVNAGLSDKDAARWAQIFLDSHTGALPSEFAAKTLGRAVRRSLALLGDKQPAQRAIVQAQPASALIGLRLLEELELPNHGHREEPSRDFARALCRRLGESWTHLISPQTDENREALYCLWWRRLTSGMSPLLPGVETLHPTRTDDTISWLLEGHPPVPFYVELKKGRRRSHEY